MRIDAARAWLMDQLVHSESAALDADCLLCAVLDCSRTYLFTWPERELDAAQWARLQALAARRVAGEPVAHLLGRREFWSLPLMVDASTLIPRPDTEVLVEQALARLPVDGTEPVLDLGTGTGAIALAIKSERPARPVWAVEFSEAALTLARRNSAALNLPLELRQGSWFGPLAGQRFALIASNPPYIDGADPHLAQGDVRFEPASALVAQEQGLADLRHIIQLAPDHLLPGGWLLLEHGWQQGMAVRQLLSARGFVQVETCRDYGDQERVSLGQWPATDDLLREVPCI
ncbi:peptide chain release factor N(5)-glutamine methyltransferase [Pseudaeromonas paramecii]|uniref:Release factor glutamine methyltransferase n=1 Tax=Pseudaeromonas paramecii TaxID=2138166 RepID=A0ABP8Q3N7_9GAMM